MRVFNENFKMKDIFILLFNFFTVPSLRLFAFLFLVSLLAVFFDCYERGVYSFWDLFGFTFVFSLFVFFPFSRSVYRFFCLCFFVLSFVFFFLVLFLFSFVLGGA